MFPVNSHPHPHCHYSGRTCRLGQVCCVRHCTKCFRALFLQTALGNRYSHPSLVEKETEGQRGQTALPLDHTLAGSEAAVQVAPSWRSFPWCPRAGPPVSCSSAHLAALSVLPPLVCDRLKEAGKGGARSGSRLRLLQRSTVAGAHQAEPEGL